MNPHAGIANVGRCNRANGGSWNEGTKTDRRSFLAQSISAWRTDWRRGMTEPGFGAGFKKALLTKPGPWQFWIGGWGECLPRSDNRVTLHPTLKDKWGIPALHVQCTWARTSSRCSRTCRSRPWRCSKPPGRATSAPVRQAEKRNMIDAVAFAASLPPELISGNCNPRPPGDDRPHSSIKRIRGKGTLADAMDFQSFRQLPPLLKDRPSRSSCGGTRHP